MGVNLSRTACKSLFGLDFSRMGAGMADVSDAEIISFENREDDKNGCISGLSALMYLCRAEYISGLESHTTIRVPEQLQVPGSNTVSLIWTREETRAGLSREHRDISGWMPSIVEQVVPCNHDRIREQIGATIEADRRGGADAPFTGCRDGPETE